jgi:hypothetical protein
MNNFTVIPLNVPLNFRQNQIINLPYRQNWMGRAVAFVKENPGTCLEVTRHKTDAHRATVLWGVMLGPCVYEYLKGITQISPETNETLLVAAISFLAFEGLVIMENIYDIKNSDMYLSWKADHKEAMALSLGQSFSVNGSLTAKG